MGCQDVVKLLRLGIETVMLALKVRTIKAGEFGQSRKEDAVLANREAEYPDASGRIPTC